MTTKPISREELETALRDLQQRYDILVNIAPVGIFQADAQGRCLYVNARWCDITGLPAEQALGDGWVRALHPDDKERIFQEWYAATGRRLPFVSEYRFLRPSGEIRWVFGQGVAEHDDQDHVVGYVGAVTDITEHKGRDEVLRDLQQELELRVQQRTMDLMGDNLRLQSDKVRLEQLNRVFMDREARIMELQREVNALCEALGRPIRYQA